MNQIQVTWNDGLTTTRNTAKLFPFAWRAVNTSKTGRTQQVWGLSSSKAAAERSAKSTFSGFSGTTTIEVKAI